MAFVIEISANHILVSLKEMSANKSGISVVSANKNSTSETNSTIALIESKVRFTHTNPKKGKWKNAT